MVLSRTRRNQHVFALEGFLDEIASASGIDPYLMRRKLLKGKPDC